MQYLNVKNRLNHLGDTSGVISYFLRCRTTYWDKIHEKIALETQFLIKANLVKRLKATAVNN